MISHWTNRWVLLLVPLALGSKESDLARNNGEFALNLYKELATQTEGNIFFSPFSISMAMAMVYLGAKGNTQAEMGNVLKYQGLPELHESFKSLRNILTSTDDVKLNIANRPYGRKDFDIVNDYVEDISKTYGGELAKLDFLGDPDGSRTTINEWVEEQTNNKIEDLLPEGFISSDTVLVLVNAIYFKGMWKLQFNQSLTVKDTFHQDADDSIDVDMMTMRDKKFAMGWSEELGARLISLPYEGDKFDMVIVLPVDVDGLGQLEDKLNMGNLNAALESMSHEQEVSSLKVPKFKLLQEVNLVDRFESLGINDLFQNSADLSGIDGKGELKVSDVVHKAYIDVNEEGTEAAAATGIGIVLMSLPPSFIADHPFMFLIRDRATNSILFLGRFKQAPVEGGNTIGTLMRQRSDDTSGAKTYGLHLVLMIFPLVLSGVY